MDTPDTTPDAAPTLRALADLIHAHLPSHDEHDSHNRLAMFRAITDGVERACAPEHASAVGVLAMIIWSSYTFEIEAPSVDQQLTAAALTKVSARALELDEPSDEAIAGAFEQKTQDLDEVISPIDAFSQEVSAEVFAALAATTLGDDTPEALFEMAAGAMDVFSDMIWSEPLDAEMATDLPATQDLYTLFVEALEEQADDQEAPTHLFVALRVDHQTATEEEEILTVPWFGPLEREDRDWAIAHFALMAMISPDAGEPMQPALFITENHRDAEPVRAAVVSLGIRAMSTQEIEQMMTQNDGFRAAPSRSATKKKAKKKSKKKTSRRNKKK